MQCVQCKSLRWERDNRGSYTWTFVLPAQPTDERKGREWGGEKGGRGGSEKGEAKKGGWGYGEKRGDTGKWRRERLLYVMCRFVCFKYHFQPCGSFPLLMLHQSTFLLHLDTTPHIEYASMHKLTLRNPTQLTKNSSREGSGMSTMLECWVLFSSPSPQRGWAWCIIDWLLDSLRTSQQKGAPLYSVLYKSACGERPWKTSINFSWNVSLLLRVWLFLAL